MMISSVTINTMLQIMDMELMALGKPVSPPPVYYGIVSDVHGICKKKAVDIVLFSC
jgi:hypothetical protein